MSHLSFSSPKLWVVSAPGERSHVGEACAARPVREVLPPAAEAAPAQPTGLCHWPAAWPRGGLGDLRQVGQPEPAALPHPRGGPGGSAVHHCFLERRDTWSRERHGSQADGLHFC